MVSGAPIQKKTLALEGEQGGQGGRHGSSDSNAQTACLSGHVLFTSAAAAAVAAAVAVAAAGPGHQQEQQQQQRCLTRCWSSGRPGRRTPAQGIVEERLRCSTAEGLTRAQQPRRHQTCRPGLNALCPVCWSGSHNCTLTPHQPLQLTNHQQLQPDSPRSQ